MSQHGETLLKAVQDALDARRPSLLVDALASFAAGVEDPDAAAEDLDLVLRLLDSQVQSWLWAAPWEHARANDLRGHLNRIVDAFPRHRIAYQARRISGSLPGEAGPYGAAYTTGLLALRGTEGAVLGLRLDRPDSCSAGAAEQGRLSLFGPFPGGAQDVVGDLQDKVRNGLSYCGYGTTAFSGALSIVDPTNRYGHQVDDSHSYAGAVALLLAQVALANRVPAKALKLLPLGIVAVWVHTPGGPMPAGGLSAKVEALMEETAGLGKLILLRIQSTERAPEGARLLRREQGQWLIGQSPVAWQEVYDLAALADSATASLLLVDNYDDLVWHCAKWAGHEPAGRTWCSTRRELVQLPDPPGTGASEGERANLTPGSEQPSESWRPPDGPLRGSTYSEFAATMLLVFLPIVALVTWFAWAAFAAR